MFYMLGERTLAGYAQPERRVSRKGVSVRAPKAKEPAVHTSFHKVAT